MRHQNVAIAALAMFSAGCKQTPEGNGRPPPPGAPPPVVVGPQVRVDVQNQNSGVETVVAVSPTNPLEVVGAAIDWRLWVPSGADGAFNPPKTRMGYAISFDGGDTWAAEGVLLRPVITDQDPFAGSEHEVDPFVATDPLTGDIWLGGMVGEGGPSGLFVARKPAGASVFEGTRVVAVGTTVSEDKALAVIGPRPGAPGERNLYIAWSRTLDVPHLTPGVPAGVPCQSQHLVVARSRSAGSTWGDFEILAVKPPSHQFSSCQFSGFGAVPLVLSTGRLVIVYLPGSGLAVAGPYAAVYSDGEGASTPPPNPTSTWNQTPVGLFNHPGFSVALGGDIAGRFPLFSMPAAAVDPVNDDIYVAVSARSAPGSTNLDLWVQRVTNQGTSPGPPLRLPLDLAEIPFAPDQIMPAIAVDRSCGPPALDLLYYDTRHHQVPDTADFAFLDVYYARVTDFGSRAMQIQTRRLTPVTFDTSSVYERYLNTPLDPNAQFIGDYHMINGVGALRYACYMSIQTGKRHVYMHRISTCTGPVVDPAGEAADSLSGKAAK